MLNELALDGAVLRLNDRLGDLVGVSIEGSDGRTIAKIVGFLSSFAQEMLETDDPLTERLVGPDIGPWYMVVPRPPAGDPLHEFIFTLSPDVVLSVEESESADYPEDGGGMEFGLRDGVRIALRWRP